MSEYFIEANSFAAPFFSDTSEHWIEANNPKEALEKLAIEYTHPCGLFAAVCYKDANARYKGQKPIAKWLCNHELAKQENSPEGSYSYLGHGAGKFEIDGKLITVEYPKEGKVIFE